MDQLLHLLHSDGADELRLNVGQPPVIVLDGVEELLEGLAITAEEAQVLLRSISTSRQRRELQDHGVVEFIYSFRGRTSFVVRARLKEENIALEIR